MERTSSDVTQESSTRLSTKNSEQNVLFKKRSAENKEFKSPRKTSQLQYEVPYLEPGTVDGHNEGKLYSNINSESRRNSTVNGSHPAGRLSVSIGHPSVGGGRISIGGSRPSISGDRSSVGVVGRFSRVGRPSWHTGRRMTSFASDERQTMPRYENTFHLGPNEGEQFLANRVQLILEQELTTKLTGKLYNSVESKELSLDLSNLIKKRVKELGCRRYKMVCSVSIGQNVGQGVESASRCLWDDHLDSQVTASFKNSSLFAVATVFAVYFE